MKKIQRTKSRRKENTSSTKSTLSSSIKSYTKNNERPTKAIRPPKNHNQPLAEATIYDIARSIALSEKKTITLNNIVKELVYKKRASYYIEELLEELIVKGVIEHTKGYSLGHSAHIHTGAISISRGGACFCVVENGEDIFIPQEGMYGVANNDTATVLVINNAKEGKRAEGVILSINTKGRVILPAKAVQKVSLTSFIFIPLAMEVPARFIVTFAKEEDIPFSILRGIYALEKIGEQTKTLWEAKIIDYLGLEENASTQEKIAMLQYTLPKEFPSAVLHEVEQMPTHVDIALFPHRKNLSHLPFVTIDGDDSRDFDDAIYVEKSNQGYTLYVAIADVTHYMHHGTALDTEAQKRSNSYYFPSSVIPMLPKILSNGICSLNPHVPRLTVVVQMHYSKEGNLLEHSVYDAIISSHARLTYTQVQRFLDKESPLIIHSSTNKEHNHISSPTDIEEMILNAKNIADILHTNRKNRGGLFFTSTTPHFTIEEDRVTNVAVYPHYYSHSLIEECMLAANECIADILTQAHLPVAYRIHPSPTDEKLQNLRKYATYIFPKVHFPKATETSFIQCLLQVVENTPQESVFHSVAIRSMMQAKYSLEHEEHYGLQSHTYCHFTSPIRRYADVLVHRSLKVYMQKDSAQEAKKELMPLEEMSAVLEQLNKNERIAMNAERDVHKRLGVLFMERYVGTTCEAIISGMSGHALYINFPQYSLEGIVLLSSLSDDYYEVIQEQQRIQGRRTGKSYALGDEVLVQIARASTDDMEVQCILQEHAGSKTVFINRNKKITARLQQRKASSTNGRTTSSQKRKKTYDSDTRMHKRKASKK